MLGPILASILAVIACCGDVVVVGGGVVVVVVGGGSVVGAVVGACVVGGGCVGGGCVGGGAVVGGCVGSTITVGCGPDVVVLGGSVVVAGGAVVVVAGTRVVLVTGGCVGTATLLPPSSSPPSATKATRPIAHSAMTAPAMMRDAVTICVPLRVPRERRIASAARAASTSATIVPTSGSTMLTNAHTSAATANGSTLGFPPQPPSPVPPPAAPVGSGSGPTGIAPVSSGPHGGGPEAGIGSHYRRCIRETGHLGASARVGRLLAMATAVFPVTGDPEADELLVSDPFALLVGMLLDQQVPMEWAFRGPATLRGRLGTLDAKSIAAMSPDEVDAVFRQKPALHRYPGSMAKRTYALATHIVDQYDGDAAAIWRDVQDPKALFDRLRALPGFGEEKARIFLAILGKRLGVAPPGWEQYAGPFGDANPRSVADIDSPEALLRVRAWKQAQKKAGKTKAQESVSG